MVRAARIALVLGFLGCGDSAATPPDSGLVGRDAEPLAPDPGELRCGAEVCAVPSKVCCHESVSPGGVDHCLGRAECDAPNRACDESTDCAAGEMCCSVVVVLPSDAIVSGFVGTVCVDMSSEMNCLPEPGVGNSSVPACKDDDECQEGACTIEACHGYPLMTCGGNANCS